MVEQKEYFAHINHNGQKQTVQEHLLNVANMAAKFASSFNATEYGFLAGITHDVGKYSEEFQHRLEGGPKVDHSTAGAVECVSKGQVLTGMCVASHHGGLSDFGNEYIDTPGDDTFVGRIKKYISSSQSLSVKRNEIIPTVQKEPVFENDPYALSLWVRMLYSSLVDADYLDTETFMSGKSRGITYNSFAELQNRIDTYVERYNTPKSKLDEIRNNIRKDCIEAASDNKGIFSLTVPTGGGKTISSLSFAVKHALMHKMDRVIYVIPYTSIIEQAADVFRTILGSNNVVEHHSDSDFLYSDDLTEEQKRVTIAAENWDAPIIVTTAVQFFESIYAVKPSKCRKLHNIANSVIVFDEAQTLPVGHLKPCIAAIGSLVNYFNSTVVLCTATQPYVSDILSKYAPEYKVKEICKDYKILYDSLKRVNYRYVGDTDIICITKELSQYKQVLCIVNTRNTAKELFELLPEEGRYHLSTLMYSEHRKQTLKDIKKRLSEGKECRVISTSLIEAGVDIDFPVVFREQAGIDSIVQAAGRCNREGKRTIDSSTVTIFSTSTKAPKTLKVSVGATSEVISQFEDIGDLSCINRYFEIYRDLLGSENTDKSNAVKYLEKGISGCKLPFKTVAQTFHFIDENTKTVYIVNEENKHIIQKIINGTADKNTYRKAGKYGVNIYENHYNELLKANDIIELPSGCAYLKNSSLYDQQTGLSLKADFGKAEFF